MKKTLSILFIGTALTLAACGNKDKKPATNEPAAAAPADPAKPADPNAAAPAAPAGGDQAKPEEKKGGW